MESDRDGAKKRSKAICFGKQKRAEINKLSVKSQEINTLGLSKSYRRAKATWDNI